MTTETKPMSSGYETAGVMDFGAFESTETLNSNYARIKELELEQNILDLDVYGFTVILPEKVAPPPAPQGMLPSIPALVC